jgi:hypothetical protein
VNLSQKNINLIFYIFYKDKFDGYLLHLCQSELELTRHCSGQKRSWIDLGLELFAVIALGPWLGRICEFPHSLAGNAKL